MKMTTLGRSDLRVSELCLGSMTWGNQTAPEDGHRQIDMALAAGINFIDTAEMYPVNPIRAETVGRTEEVIGSWLARTGRRDDVVIATKITGPNGGFVRDGAGISADTIRDAVDGSLRRLQTDVIDLYQLHWPNRGSYHFRQNWSYDPSGQDRADTIAHMTEVLETLGALVQAGKIRHIGLSNESAWGTAQWLRLSEAGAGPRVQTIQNEYSLLNRLYDTDLAELAVNEDVTLLAFSPLGAGLLTGKYAGDVTPDGSRRENSTDLGGRITPRVWEAVSAYLGVANAHGLDPVHMALAFTLSRPFPTVPIFGATTVAQLEHILRGVDLTLSDAVLSDIAVAHKAHPMPY
ncbi:aldo/keto reductase [Actibacterium ureilyticum]|uniref:aldo/keto reductase n=1 Tax=Actibacterium ureilyticum TaxID=1590614 RepID=UPI000BAB1DAA|nr:aldo/keto reductase [Actibacterium ureilyticum]